MSFLRILIALPVCSFAMTSACGPTAAPSPTELPSAPPMRTPAPRAPPARVETATTPSASAGSTVVEVSPPLFEDRGPGFYELLGKSTRGTLFLAYRFMRSGHAPDDQRAGVTYSWNQDLILVVDGRTWREAHVFAGDQQRMRRATADEDTPARGRRYWERYAPRSVGARGYDEWFAWHTEQRLRPLDPLRPDAITPLRFELGDGVVAQPVDPEGYFVFRSRPTGLFVVRLVHGERTLWAAEASTGTLTCTTAGASGADEAEVRAKVHALADGRWVVVWSRSRSRRDCPEATVATSHEDDGGIAVIGVSP